jgi:hypothetical protein
MLKVVNYYLTWGGYTRRGGRILIWLAAASNRLSRTPGLLPREKARRTSLPDLNPGTLF